MHFLYVCIVHIYMMHNHLKKIVDVQHSKNDLFRNLNVLWFEWTGFIQIQNII